MTLLKMLVLSNVLDPTVSLQELIGAFRDLDEIEDDDNEPSDEPPDARDVAVRNLALLL